ncbi:LysM peptidoglycan-binding domain-containing protein [Enterococcus thailandicus]|uniref:LysM peptidoglycan-binding domain-containing protein n=1 Tax=Enterococcus thailandicus TaxID=417368 RepID=UPI002891FB7E|nr:LysM peptidoglycan-binding domain-containing protein [Enterococcus thailandicus]MDT2795584.1 LysM peptidoglycan-binding domain-containing protein [Enterococcus thailandicus]
MEKATIGRKERRRQEEKKRFRNAKRGVAAVGTAMVGCSVAAPLIQPVPVAANELPAQVGARINTSAFIAEISTYAQPIAQANDLYASVMIAQAVVESGWGSSALSQSPYHNLFGIKGSYQGQTVYMNTLEYLNNKWVTKKEPFRHYPTFAESFSDNAYVLRNTSFSNGYYYAGTWKSNTKSYTEATAALTGRYATDPTYSTKLNNIIVTYGLTKYDTPATGNAGGGATTGSGSGVNTGTGSNNSVTTPTDNGSTTTTSTYTVKSGDSVWGIANAHGITMAQLIDWNNIKNNFVYPGQRLTIKGKQSTGSSTNNSGSNTNSSGNSNATNTQPSNGSKYTVKSGDSVWGISNAHGITMNQLIQWNNIKNNFVYPGQQLVVSNGTTGTTTNPGSSNSNANTNQSGNASASTGSYTVKAGDSVWGVANAHGITMAQLIQWNKISNNFIYPGQKLIVKNGTSSSATTNNNATTNNSNSTSSSAETTTSSTYTVKAGESVWGVANKNNITMAQLIEWNNIQNNFIYPGQKLIIKGGSTASTNSASGNATATTGNNAANTTTSSNNAKPTTSTSTSGDTLYTVKAGESVWGVANKNNITMEQFIEWNNIKNNFIYPGQKVIVKKGSAQTTAPTINSGTKKYTVKAGESVWSVANDHNLSMARFIEWNNIKDNFIYPGQSVIVAK